MTRLLTALGLAAGAVAALLLWASSRDLREPWRWPAIPTPEPDDDMAGVQVDVRPYLVSNPVGGM